MKQYDKSLIEGIFFPGKNGRIEQVKGPADGLDHHEIITQTTEQRRAGVATRFTVTSEEILVTRKVETVFW